MTITATAIEPTKSPGGPGSSTIGMNASAVVTVEASSGAKSLRTDERTASSRGAPSARRRRTSSVMTIAASTSSPSATIMPVSDICWIATPSALSVAIDASVTRGSTVATISAARGPRVTSSTRTTSATPSPMLRPTPASRSSV